MPPADRILSACIIKTKHLIIYKAANCLFLSLSCTEYWNDRARNYCKWSSQMDLSNGLGERLEQMLLRRVSLLEGHFSDGNC